MNLSTAPTPAHLPQKPASRAIGLAFVAAIHVVVFIAVSQGLMIPGGLVKPKETPTVRPIDEPPPLPKPLPKLTPKEPTQVHFDPTVVPPPIIDVTAPPPTGGIVTERGDPMPQDFTPRAPAGPPQTIPADTLRPMSAVCTRTQAPEAPSVNWSGEALFSVVAGTHAGRVNQVEIRLLRGAMDGRTQRAFKSAIESTMRETYQCPGDVRFTQEFQFRVE